jgi:hypothetical protein
LLEHDAIILLKVDSSLSSHYFCSILYQEIKALARVLQPPTD